MSNLELDYPKVYGYKVNKNRLNYQSGGAFSSIAKYLLENGYIIYGVALIGYEAKYIRCNTKEELELLAGSKYVQAKTNNIFASVEEDLKNNKKVLFSGTGCYISGCVNYLKHKKIDLENFISIELLCHGVVNHNYFDEYINRLKKNFNCDIENYKFRDKKIVGWGGEIGSFTCGNKKYISFGWMDLYHSNNFFNQSCYSCPFKSKKNADIMIADFWAVKGAAPSFGDAFGISSVWFNTKKGESALAGLELDGEAIKIKYEDAYQPIIDNPTKKQDENNHVDFQGDSKDIKAVVDFYYDKPIRIILGIPITKDIKFLVKYYAFRLKKIKAYFKKIKY